MRVVDRSFDHPLELEEYAAIPFYGGIVNHGYQCGMLWGTALAAGAQAYRLFGPGSQAETAAIIATQRLVESFRACTNNINCLGGLTAIPLSGLLLYYKGHQPPHII
ncbi:hypothetical protein ACFLYR_04160 [Chloroflexota bacterium]